MQAQVQAQMLMNNTSTTTNSPQITLSNAIAPSGVALASIPILASSTTRNLHDNFY